MLNIKTIYCSLCKEEILFVKWVDYDPFMKFNFEMSFFNIIELVNKHKVKKLILDASSRKHDPSDEDFKEIFELFLSGLSATRLEKMARISSPNPVIRDKFNRILDQIADDLYLNFQVRNFNNPGEAIAWLQIKSFDLETAFKN